MANPKSAKYPLVDGDITVASNAISDPTLSGNILSTDVTIGLSSTTGWNSPGVCRIDNELLSFAGISGGNLTGCVRGVQGSTAASHSSGTPVYRVIDADSHNQIAANVEDLSARFPGPMPFTLSPGGTAGSGSYTLTFSASMPCPLGVNFSDVGHFLYFSGGTGAAEAAQITGGTATEGGTSGTLTFVLANAHSGAWTITSATGGIQEAATHFGSGAIYLGVGIYNLYATLLMPTKIDLIGQSADTSGSNGTKLVVNSGVSPALVVADNSTYQGICLHARYQLYGSGSGNGFVVGGDPAGSFAPAGWKASYTQTSGVTVNNFTTALVIEYGSFLCFDESVFQGVGGAAAVLLTTTCVGQPIVFSNCVVTVPTGTAFQMDAASGAAEVYFNHGQISGTITGANITFQGTGLHLEPNHVTDQILNVNNSGNHFIRFVGGLISVHGAGITSSLKIAGAGLYNIFFDDVVVQCDAGTTVTNFFEWAASTGGNIALGITIVPAGTFTNTYNNTGGGAPNVMFRQPQLLTVKQAGIGVVAPIDTLEVGGGIRVTVNVGFDGSKTGRMYKSATTGMTFVTVTGSSYDYGLYTPGGTGLMEVPTGTGNIELVRGGGKVGVGVAPSAAPFAIASLASYANNAAAVTGGLAVGDLYRNGDVLQVVH